MELKSKRIKKIAVRHSKNKKTSCKLQSKKHSKAIRTTQPLANSTKADSEAILPNRTQLVFQEQLLLEKPFFHVRQKGVPPLLLPTSVPQLPRCLARIYNLDSHDTTLFELDSFQKYNCSRKNRLQNLICFANVGYSPTPRQHF